MKSVVEIDGSRGEGGGQILRSSVALAALRGQPLHIYKIRAGRARPGLKRQHLTCIRAVAEICQGQLQGDQPNGSEIHFEPQDVQAGEYHFAVGTAGSACLVFQTVLWPLLFAKGNSRVVFEGGTHNPLAPPFDFIERCFLPVIQRMGAQVELSLEKHGFMPAGGGRFIAEIEGGCELSAIDITERGLLQERRATALVANLPGTIAIRELGEVRKLLRWRHEECLPRVVQNSAGPGNALLLELAHEQVSEMVSVIGERKLTAEMVAAKATEALAAYLEVDAPVGEHLADQLVIPFSLAGGGRFRTRALTEHTKTNIDIVQHFSETAIESQTSETDVTLRFGDA